MNKKSRSPSGGSEPQENEPNTDSTTSLDADFLERFKHPMMVVDQYGEIVQFNSTFLDIDENAREELIGKYETDVIRPYDGEIDLGKTADDNDGNSTVWRAVVEGHIKTSNGMVFPVTITPRELADTSLTCLSIDCLIEKEAAKPDSERSGIASVGTDGELHVENEFFTDFFTPKPGHVHETVSDISDFVDIDGQGTFESIVMTAMDTGDHTTVTVKNPDTGQYIECSISPSEVGATIKATDMTERESKIEQLQNSTQQYRGIFNNPYVYGLIVSMEDAQVIDVNQTVLDYFGNTAEDIVGKAFTETTIWQQKTSATVDFAEVLTKIDNGEEATLKMQFDYRGEEEWFQVCCTPIYDNNSEVIGFAAVGVDSTAYENTKSKPQATEREFNALFNNPHAFTALLDTTGRIVEVNENGANVAEETREELNGMKVGDTSFTGKQQTDIDLHDEIEKAVNGETTEREYSLNVGGFDMWFNFLCMPIYDGDDVVNVFIYGQDITDFTKAERERIQYKEEAETYQRLTQMSDRVSTAVDAQTSQDAVFRTAFDVIDDSDLYDSVWVAEYNPRSKALTPLHASVGSDDIEYESMSMQELDGTLVADAIMTGCFQSTVGCDDGMVGKLRCLWGCYSGQADTCSLITIPIRVDETTYGVMGCTELDDISNEKSEQVCELLGEQIAKKLRLIRRGEFSASDDITQLDIYTERTSEEFSQMFPSGGEIEIAMMHQSGGEYRKYGSAKGMDEDVVRAAMGFFDLGTPLVDAETSAGGEAELSIKTESAECPVVEIAKNDRVEFDRLFIRDTGLHLRLNIPKGQAPRKALSEVQSVYPNAGIKSRITMNRGAQSNGELVTDVKEDLTDRQQRILEFAVEKGYWDLSDTVTQGELAEEFDISPSTLREHLKRGSKKVFDGLFKDGS